MHASSLFAYMHVPNVIPRDVIVRGVNLLVVLVAIINELRRYLYLSLLSLRRIRNSRKIRTWTVEILAVHFCSLCACMHVPNVIPKGSYCVHLVVTKQDLKF